MPPDRDAALRAALDTTARAMEELSRDVGDAGDLAREARDGAAQLGLRLDGLTRKLEALHAEQRMTLRGVLLRAVERASEKSPVQTIAAVGSASAAVLLIVLGGLYSMIWHEPPAVVVGELLSLLPLVGGP